MPLIEKDSRNRIRRPVTIMRDGLRPRFQERTLLVDLHDACVGDSRADASAFTKPRDRFEKTVLPLSL